MISKYAGQGGSVGRMAGWGMWGNSGAPGGGAPRPPPPPRPPGGAQPSRTRPGGDQQAEVAVALAEPKEILVLALCSREQLG